MKKLKKYISLVIALITVLAVGVSAFAQTVSVGGGEGKLTIANAAQGKEYTLYQLFDATVNADGSGISYKLLEGKKDLGTNGGTWFTVDSAKNVLAKPGIEEAIKSEEFGNWAKTYGKAIKTEIATDANLVFEKVPYGYYYVKSPLGAIVTVDSTKPEVTVIDKNPSKPSIPDDQNGGGKQIVVSKTADGKDVVAKQSTAKIGDTVSFRIKFNGTNFITENEQTTKVFSYNISDMPVGLKLTDSTVKVSVAGIELDATKYTKTVANDGKLDIVIPWTSGTVADGYKSIYNDNDEIVITYDAVVTKNLANGEATNTATIGYKKFETPIDPNNPQTPPTPPAPDKPVIPVDPNKPEDKTVVKTHEFKLKKVNEANEKLSGAEFKLYSTETGDEEIKVVKEGSAYRVLDATSAPTETAVAIEAGEVVVKGLKGETEYWLEEIKAPAGYNILTSRQKVTVKSDNSTEATITNKKGAELPSTGAMGTTMLYVAGSLLLLVAVVYSISKRRMNQM